MIVILVLTMRSPCCWPSLPQGNVTPAAKFNMYVDPHAARIVFEAELPITLLSLEVTHQVVSTPERIQAFEQLATAWPLPICCATMAS
jgi:inosine-uridine nucleoside N-ribohydrolase